MNPLTAKVCKRYSNYFHCDKEIKDEGIDGLVKLENRNLTKLMIIIS